MIKSDTIKVPIKSVCVKQDIFYLILFEKDQEKILKFKSNSIFFI